MALFETFYDTINFAIFPNVVVIISLTHKAVFLILSSRKRKFLSEFIVVTFVFF